MHEYLILFLIVLSSCVCNYVGFQALIQYQSRQSAVAARTTLQVAFSLLFCYFELNAFLISKSWLDLKKV